MPTQFVVRGNLSGQFPVRVLDLFAQQDVLLEHVSLRRTGACYELAIVDDVLSDARAELVVQKLRTMVLVESAERLVLGT